MLPKDRWAGVARPRASTDPSDVARRRTVDLVDALELRPVSTRVNSVRNNDPSLMDRVGLAQDEKPAPTLFELP